MSITLQKNELSFGQLNGTIRRHLKTTGGDSFFNDYDFAILPYAADYITIQYGLSLLPFQTDSKQIKLTEKSGFSIKINKKSIGCDSGNAEELINFLSGWIGCNFIPKIFEQFIFSVDA